MFSNPAPIPQSIKPDLILVAICITDSMPLEHYLFNVKDGVWDGRFEFLIALLTT